LFAEENAAGAMNYRPDRLLNEWGGGGKVQIAKMAKCCISIPKRIYFFPILKHKLLNIFYNKYFSIQSTNCLACT
jgi:hypothetical protein